jgi:hypothetical protein
MGLFHYNFSQNHVKILILKIPLFIYKYIKKKNKTKTFKDSRMSVLQITLNSDQIPKSLQHWPRTL